MSRLSAQKSGFIRTFAFLLILLATSPNASAGTINIGVGLGFSDGDNFSGFDAGQIYQIGYEFDKGEDWYLGDQLQFLNGWNDRAEVLLDVTGTQMAFDAQALYATARPNKWPLLFKVGVVNANYVTSVKSVSATGFAIGIGLDIEFGTFRLNLLDYSRYYIRSDVVNVYTLSLVLWG